MRVYRSLPYQGQDTSVNGLLARTLFHSAEHYVIRSSSIISAKN